MIVQFVIFWIDPFFFYFRNKTSPFLTDNNPRKFDFMKNYIIPSKYPSRKKIWQILFFVAVLSLTILLLISVSVSADDDEDDEEDDDNEDLSSSLGWASVGLFVVSAIYIVFYQSFKLTRRISEESRLANLKTNYGNFFRKIRKPFLYIHYISGLLALGVLIVHGILLTDNDTSALIGWVTAGVYIFYILTGIVLWFKIISPKKTPKLRKAVLYIHRSLILYVLIVVIHIIHLAISD
jgi:magnesium-transporting ATPase (P-type)